MLDKFRETAITWDKATSRIYSPVTANASDENGRKLVVQIVNSGQVEDLTGATLHLYWETRDKAHDGLDVFKAVDLKKGEFELSYTTGMLSNHGVLNANLVLIDTVGRVVSERFKITVTEGIDDDAIQSENSFSSLTQALIDISNLEQNYAPRLNDLTAQLQQTEQSINAQLAQRASKEELSTGLLTKVSHGENESVSMDMLGQDIKNAINSGVWDVNVNTSDIENSAVTSEKVAYFLKPNTLVPQNTEAKLPNFDTSTYVFSIPNSYVFSGTTRVAVSESSFNPHPDGVGFQPKIVIDIKTGVGRRVSGFEPITNDEVIIAIFAYNASKKLIDLQTNFTFTIDNKPSDLYFTQERAIETGKLSYRSRPKQVVTHFQTSQAANFDTKTHMFHMPKLIVSSGNSRITLEESDYILSRKEALSQTVKIVYDFEKMETQARADNILNNENEVVLLVATFDDFDNLLDMQADFSFTIDDMSKFDYFNNREKAYEERNRKKFIFNTNKLLGNYPSIERVGQGEIGGHFNYETDTHETIYTLYDDLVTEFPDYITRKLEGYDQSGLLPIYSYSFEPKNPSPQPKLTWPKITLNAGVHGDENTSVYALYYMMSDICKDWKNDENLRYLRNYVTIEIIPLANPYGFNQKTYMNSRGVNINRNFDNNWSKTHPTLPGSGDSAASEAETQILQNFLNRHSDSLFHIDMHTRGGRQLVADNYLMELITGRIYDMAMVRDINVALSERWREEYPNNTELFNGYPPSDSSFITGPMVQGYADNKCGISAMTYEAFSRSNLTGNQLSDVDNRQVLKMNTETIGEVVLAIIKRFQ